MSRCLSVTYMSLLLISSISSCLLFLIVASEASKPNSDDGVVSDGGESVKNNLNIKSQKISEEIVNVVTQDSLTESLNVVAPGALPPPGRDDSVNNAAPFMSTAYDEITTATASHGPGVSEIDATTKNSGMSDISVDDGDKIEFGTVPKIVDDALKQSQHQPADDNDESIIPDKTASPAVGADLNVESSRDVAEETLPDIPVNPAVITLNDKTPEEIFDGLHDTEDHDHNDMMGNQTEEEVLPNVATKNGFVVITDEKLKKKDTILSYKVPPDESPPKIDDSGGSVTSNRQAGGVGHDELKDNNIPSMQETAGSIIASSGGSEIPVQSGDETTSSMTTASTTTATTPEVNLTVEENPIPVFSEWAQKQMEEAEKKLEKEVVNSSTMKKNTVAGNKPQPMKLRAKNYASPDCGAKIIASNSDAQNTGALLTATKDEYMLSPCTNRIWFVVELCEAIQAEKIELANFELFSSSPKNFSVAVSNRFPTREWSNVGRFIADDQRNIQSFELYPHLFGKFVRVDIHSHYNSEHFCPISLFRVYGTSEFEAFETENRLPADDIDEFDDEDAIEVHAKNENNLFKSASDAVMSIVKKAAEALVKTQTNRTDTVGPDSKLPAGCISLRRNFICEKCSEAMVNRTNHLLSCRYNQLVSLLSSVPTLKAHLMQSQICANRFNLDASNLENLGCKQPMMNSSQRQTEQQSFLLSLFPAEYVAAFCHILSVEANSRRYSKYGGSAGSTSDPAMNLTIDQKAGSQQFIAIEPPGQHAKQVVKQKLPKLPTKGGTEEQKRTKKPSKVEKEAENIEVNTFPPDENNNKTENPEDPRTVDHEKEARKSSIDPALPQEHVVETIEEEKPSIVPDVNIFNLFEEEIPETTERAASSADDVQTVETNSVQNVASSQPPPVKVEPTPETPPNDIEPTPWDNIEQILGEHVSSETVGNADGMPAPFHQLPQRVHSESVFLRLSNRIKALERNMSLSGQYLEELSRRYKKQVEELQHSFAKTLTSIDDQNRRGVEREHILITQNRNLKDQLDEISTRLYYWIIFGLCFFLILLIQTVLLWLRNRRENIRILKQLERYSNNFRRTSTPRKADRRKSVEGVSGHPSPTHKVRRPSEEADRITGSYKNLLIGDDNEENIENIGSNGEAADTLSEIGRKNPKIRYRKISNGRRNGSNSFESKSSLASSFCRQESAPGDFVRPNVSPTSASQDDDKMLLEDDYETYVPGTDLAYNEFMPEGPSGENSLSSSTMNGKLQNGTKATTKKSKVRRLSSPGFLKSTFSRSGSTRKTAHSPTNWEWYRLRKSEPKTELLTSSTDNPTKNSSSQENRTNVVSGGDKKSMKKSKAESPEMSIKINGFGNGDSSTPNSSIPEIPIGFNHNGSNFGGGGVGGGSDDSLRNSDTSIATGTGSLLSNGNRSNSKKHGSFRRMLKKVF